MSRLELSLLGAFRVELDGSAVSDFGTDKNRALLAYVCVEASRAHRREALAGLLWPEQPDEAARRNLRQALYKLRQVLATGVRGEGLGVREAADGQILTPNPSPLTPVAPDLLRVTALDVQLDPDGDYWSDVGAFTGLMTAYRTHRHRKAEQCSTCHARLRQAAELYGGDFLAGFFLEDSQAFDEWLALKREGFQRLALEAFSRLAGYHEARAEYEPALQYAYRQLELEPWREEAHRQVMKLLALTGQRSAALAQYETCRQVLAAELNTEPSAETIALYERLRAQSILDFGFSILDYGPGANPKSKIQNPKSAGLPRQLTPFIGRRAELERIIERLDSPDYCLITVMGPGGVGKTRLALQAASRQVGAFDDGVYWVPLASIDSPQLLVSSIAQAIGFHFEASEDPQAQLLDYLRDKEMLLLLDNFEHVLAGAEATDLLVSILMGAPRISMIVTSRERLGLQAEYLVDLSGLLFPGHDDGRAMKSYTIEDDGGEGSARLTSSSIVHPSQAQDPSSLTSPNKGLESYDAVQLFIERAQQANSEFTLSADTAQGVIDICRLVAGLPLGIVLAAAWVRHFSPARIAAGVRANLDFLSSASRDASAQHSSLRAVFSHSWNLLPEEEQRVFRGLSVFRGGWEEEAAERVAGAAMLPLLSLVDKSLLRRSASGRFDMHEVLRQYATEQLDEAPDEREEVKRRHAEYYVELAEFADRQLRGEEQDKWLERLEQEHDNLRAALAWANEGLGAPDFGFWILD